MPINNSLYSKADILEQIPLIFDEVAQVIQNTPDELFSKQVIEGKWSIAENFDHLIRGGAPVASGLKMNKLMIRTLGKPNRLSRTYEGLVERYKEKLAAGGVSSGPFSPDAAKEYHKAEMLQNWEMVKGKLIERADTKWSEKDLDNYLMPHPLLGKLTVREILFFTIFHTGHHLKAINRIVEN
ncbi:MAG: DinB family protein [Chitinophagales bacterium]